MEDGCVGDELCQCLGRKLADASSLPTGTPSFQTLLSREPLLGFHRCPEGKSGQRPGSSMNQSIRLQCSQNNLWMLFYIYFVLI